MIEKRGKFIVFEGIGGSGKDTQIEKLEDYFKELGKSVFVTREHTRNTPLGELVEDIIKKKKDSVHPTALQLLYLSDRVNHTENVIKPGLENYDFGLGNRYRGSTISYAPPELRKYFLKVHQEVTIRPDLVIILDLDPIEAAKRVGKRGDADIFDTVERLKICRNGYEWYAKHSGDPCAWINADENKEEVFEKVLKEIEKRKII